MGARRDARKLAIRILYIVEVLGATPREAIDIVGNQGYSRKAVEFAHRLVFGTIENLDFLDNIIARHTKNWEPERIANVDRIIIRIGLYEIYFEDSIPKNASINEAVELAKYFSTSKSHKFVNGILDAGSRDKTKK